MILVSLLFKDSRDHHGSLFPRGISFLGFLLSSKSIPGVGVPNCSSKGTPGIGSPYSSKALLELVSLALQKALLELVALTLRKSLLELVSLAL